MWGRSWLCKCHFLLIFLGDRTCLLGLLRQDKGVCVCVLNVNKPQFSQIRFEARNLCYQQFFIWCDPVWRNARFQGVGIYRRFMGQKSDLALTPKFTFRTHSTRHAGSSEILNHAVTILNLSLRNMVTIQGLSSVINKCLYATQNFCLSYFFSFQHIFQLL